MKDNNKKKNKCCFAAVVIGILTVISVAAAQTLLTLDFNPCHAE